MSVDIDAAAAPSPERAARLEAASRLAAAADRAARGAAANTIREIVRGLGEHDPRVSAARFTFTEAATEDGGSRIEFGAFLAADGATLPDLFPDGEWAFEEIDQLFRHADEVEVVADAIETHRNHHGEWAAYVFRGDGPASAEQVTVDAVGDLLLTLDTEAIVALRAALPGA